MTPIEKIIRIALNIFVVDYADQRRFVASGASLDDASWVANAIAGYHGVSLEETNELLESK